MDKVSVIIISYNCKDDTVKCIESIALTCKESIPEIIVVDNNSSDDTVETLISSFQWVKVIQNKENKGYAYAINQGVAASSGDYLILSNADVIYLDGTILGLVKDLKAGSNIGLIAPQQIFKNGNYQRSYGLFPSIKRGIYDLLFLSSLSQKLSQYKFNRNQQAVINVEYLDGAILCTNKIIFNELDGFDENFFFYSEETDFCYRLKQNGYDRVLTQKYRAIHRRGGSQENSGMNPQGIDKLIKSEAQFVMKFKSPNHLKIYFNLKYIFFKLLYLINIVRGNSEKGLNCSYYMSSIKGVLSEKI